MSSTTTPTKLPTLPARDLSSILINCAAILFTVCFAGGLWMVMR